MAYTNNVPQATQTIAATQPLIQANFAFIETDLQVEHQFNGNVPGQAEGTHLKTSMPNRALSPAIPAGCNGVYFLSSSAPFFYEGSFNWQLNAWERVLGGTFTVNSSSTYDNIVAIPANRVGMIHIWGNGFALSGSFYTDGTVAYGFSTLVKKQGSGTSYAVELNNACPALTLQGRAGTEASGLTYNYRAMYRP